MLHQIETGDTRKSISEERSSTAPWAAIFAVALIVVFGALLLMLTGLSNPTIDPTTAIMIGP
jgi:hypothetical protein